MKTCALITVFFVVLFFSPEAAVQQKDVTVFRNVHIIPMTREVILEGQTIIIEGNTITSIGDSSEIPIPPGANVIEGDGAYLIPGLSDMHTHLYAFEKDPAHLLLYLKHGVTTVRSLNGDKNNLVWRERVRDGKLQGPTIYTSGPVLSGLYGTDYGIGTYITLFHIGVAFLPLLVGVFIYVVVKKLIDSLNKSDRRVRKSTLVTFAILLMILGIAMAWIKIIPFMAIGRFFVLPEYNISETAAQAASAVKYQKRAGYDMIKMYDSITQEAYLSAVREAKRLDLYVTGHCPDQIPLEILLSSGQDEIGHIDELQTYHWIGYNDGSSGDSSITLRDFEFDYESIDRTKRLLVENDINLVSTLVTKEVMYRLIEDNDRVFAGEEYRYLRREKIDYWRTRGSQVKFDAAHGRYRKESMQPFLIELTKILHEAGLTIVIGSAATQEGVVPGYHLLRELEILTEIGLTPYEALEMGTKNAGVVVNQMGLDGNFGTIEIGQRADLILVRGNPLESILNIHDRIGVMVRGRWYSQEDINQQVDEFLSTY